MLEDRAETSFDPQGTDYAGASLRIELLAFRRSAVMERSTVL